MKILKICLIFILVEFYFVSLFTESAHALAPKTLIRVIKPNAFAHVDISKVEEEKKIENTMELLGAHKPTKINKINSFAQFNTVMKIFEIILIFAVFIILFKFSFTVLFLAPLISLAVISGLVIFFLEYKRIKHFII